MTEEEKKPTEKKMEKKEEKQKVEGFFFRKYTIIQEYQYDTITLREYDSMECDGAAILEGFNKGLTSIMTTNYIVEQLKLPLVGDIVSPKFQSYSKVEEGFPMRGCRIYGNKRLVVFASDYDFKDPQIQFQLINAIYDFAKRHRSTMVISVDGVPGDPSKTVKEKITIKNLKPKEPQKPPSKLELKKLVTKGQEYEQKVWYLTNDELISKKMVSLGHSPVKTMAVTGISGGILADSPFRCVNVVAIFGNLDPFLKIGTKTAIALIVCIDQLLGENVKIDMSELTETNKKIEDKIMNIVETIKTPTTAKKPSSWQSMYS